MNKSPMIIAYIALLAAARINTNTAVDASVDERGFANLNNPQVILAFEEEGKILDTLRTWGVTEGIDEAVREVWRLHREDHARA